MVLRENGGDCLERRLCKTLQERADVGGRDKTRDEVEGNGGEGQIDKMVVDGNFFCGRMAE